MDYLEAETLYQVINPFSYESYEESGYVSKILLLLPSSLFSYYFAVLGPQMPRAEQVKLSAHSTLLSFVYMSLLHCLIY
jgi:hypothetical protein